jgi:serine-type D-Ala-D-Ala endopeptidase (penicillin-binding protein 7)
VRSRLTRGAICVLSVLLSLGLVASTSEGASKSGGSTKRSTTVKKKKQSGVKRASAVRRSTLSRRARLARARAAARARQWLEASTPKFKTDEAGNLVPDVRAAAAIIYNPETNEILYQANAQNPRSIASITKVMTAAVFLEDEPDLTERVSVERADVRGARHTYLRAGEQVTLDDLLHLTLIASDNAAARALARASAYGTDGFLNRMNEKARELGLESTTYADPSGLNPDNMSSAFDMARLIAFASSDERISSIMRKSVHALSTDRRTINIHSTNQLVMKGDVDVRGGKTGFINKAGYCLATLLRLPQTGQQVAVVILGAKSSAGRFMEARHLFNWLNSRTPDLIAAPLAAPQSAAQPQDN